MCHPPKRPTLSQLAARCRIASMEIPAGSFWKHYKSDDVYEVIGMSIREADGDVEVLYRPAPRLEEDRYGGLERYYINEPDLSFLSLHRPVSEWQEFVTVELPNSTDLNNTLEIERFRRVRRVEVYAD